MCSDMAVTGGTMGGGDHGGTMGDSLFGVVCYKKTVLLILRGNAVRVVSGPVAIHLVECVRSSLVGRFVFATLRHDLLLYPTAVPNGWTNF